MPEQYNPESKALIVGKRNTLNALVDRFDRLDRENGYWEPVYKASEIAAIKAGLVEFDIPTDDWEGNDEPPAP